MAPHYNKQANNDTSQSLINRVEYINEIIRNSCYILKCLASMFLIAIDINILNTFFKGTYTTSVIFIFIIRVHL